MSRYTETRRCIGIQGYASDVVGSCALQHRAFGVARLTQMYFSEARRNRRIGAVDTRSVHIDFMLLPGGWSEIAMYPIIIIKALIET